MRGLANQRSLHSFLVGAAAGVLLALAGCATTRPTVQYTPPPPPYALTSGGIGVSVVSQPPSTVPVSVGRTGKPATESTRVGLSGWGSFGPGALLIVPFAAAYAAYDESRRTTQSEQCDAKLISAYPGAPAMFREVVQREFIPEDVQDGFVGAFRKHSTAEVVAVASPLDPRDIENTQHLLSTATDRGLAYLIVVEVLSAELAPLHVDCEQWAFIVRLQVSLWNTAN